MPSLIRNFRANTASEPIADRLSADSCQAFPPQYKSVPPHSKTLPRQNTPTNLADLLPELGILIIGSKKQKRTAQQRSFSLAPIPSPPGKEEADAHSNHNRRRPLHCPPREHECSTHNCECGIGDHEPGIHKCECVTRTRERKCQSPQSTSLFTNTNAAFTTVSAALTTVSEVPCFQELSMLSSL